MKPEKTADCVVVGVRWKSRPDRIATLLLGLYDEDGEIDYVGSAAVAPARHARSPSACSRSSRTPRSAASRSRTAGEAASSRSRRCDPKLVVEVRYDKVQSNRFRHGTKLIRFRDDKDPAQCTWRELRPARARGVGVEKLLRAGR